VIKNGMQSGEWKLVRDQCLAFIYGELETEDNVNLPMACLYVKGQKPEDNF